MNSRASRTNTRRQVDLLTAREAADDTRLPWWACTSRTSRSSLDPTRWALYSLQFTAPRIEPSLHPPWLEAQLDCPVH